MHPIIKHVCTPEVLARQGVRGIDDLTAEELTQRRRPWVMTTPRTANPA